LRAQENLRRSSAELGQTYERLSSGMRINRASDDAAGLSIADILRADARIAKVAIRNINDGISLVNVIQGGLQEISSILIRMSELAIQSKNGTITTKQLSPIVAEYEGLRSEIDRIAQTTSFNGIKVLSSNEIIYIQAGFKKGITDNSNVDQEEFQIRVNSMLVDSDQLGLAPGGGNGYELDSDKIQNALDTVKLYDDQSVRLPFALSNAAVMMENFSAGESGVRDVDVAKESANLVRHQIIQQAAVAILAQANVQPAIALRLLPSVLDDN
jgi:flagellin